MSYTNETLFNLWNGNLCPCNQKNDRFEETKKIVGYVDGHIKELNEQLDDKGKEILGKLDNCYVELQEIESEESFKKGFSLAIKILIEALNN